jgi:hypothetical protein
MTRDTRRLRTDLGLRAGGLLSLAIAVLAIETLTGLPSTAGPVALLLATIGFLCTSAGATLTLLGGHIHDPVKISARWQRAERQAAP